jgi:UDP-N-acetylglucosamine 2-epimerase
MTKRVLVVFGTRPECIKLAPVIAALKARPADFETIVCSSGQHRELLHQALGVFDLAVDVDLAVMQSAQDLSDLTSRMIAELSRTIDEFEPDWVVVQGDTTTALSGTLAAYYRRVRVAHVEAGLRSGDRFDPFPEEVNRRIIGVIADLHFAPTERAAETLRREGVAAASIHLTGNTIVDALMSAKARLEALGENLVVDPTIRTLPGLAGELILVTCHRRESFGEQLAQICSAIKFIANDRPNCHIVFPVHLNPNVRAQVKPLLAGLPNVHLIEPPGYFEFIYLLSRSALVLTDSGGVQEEAPTFGVPVLVLRNKTERFEAIDAGFSELIGTDADSIVARVAMHLDENGRAQTPKGLPNPFGDGKAASRIAAIMARAS